MNPYGTLCDDFGIYTYLNTEMALPTSRETVLHFFESVKKLCPSMCHFYVREGGEQVLEEEKEMGSYRWVTLESKRLCSGYVNPPSVQDADQLHERILEIAPYHLGISTLDCEALDVLFAFDFIYSGNHDAVVAEAFGLPGTLDSLVSLPNARIINYEPAVMLGLDENLRLQCRLSIETRTNAFQVRTGQYGEEPISVYFTVRQYWGGPDLKSFVDSYRHQRAVCQELVDNHIVPSVIRPLAQAINAK